MPMRSISIKKIAKRKAVFLILISNVIFFTIPLYFLVIGIWKVTSCPGNAFLPPWMIIVAFLIVIDRLIFWRRIVNETKFEKTFPRPSIIGSMERIKTWEENRVWSSSRTLLGFMAVVRVVLFSSVLIGKLWSYEVIKNDQCDHLVSYSIVIFCIFSIIIYLFFFIGTMYIHIAEWLRSLEKTMVSCVNRVMKLEE
ncbi:hypothetical protein GCK72_019737 [Caenorhabditis remanei]|uniref:G-protein coupled receptors family 1 profile domain-containing protein n=1 Tax=Caenorhabditis remanei TaxID=31234 RepID=A0A6A5GF26_CAERE|nr:hypothetical protein GCK72_019737 [Caenorhabditis remanei]KAF1753181.1 hypothetical protein GCK72_019737 [Caenorhabditis remanei]